MPRTRCVYKEGTKIKSMCRICLTQSNNIMFKLTDQLKGKNFEEETYLEALEKITFSRVDIGGGYPEGICPMCVSFLKMALEFVTQFENSQKKLEKMFGLETIKVEFNSDNEEVEYISEVSKYHSNNRAGVELIVKDQKFDLKEVVVVEQPEEKIHHDYGGFINKLGKEISASIINNGKSKKVVQDFENVSIIKVVTDEENSEEENTDQSNYENNDIVNEENIEFIVESPEYNHEDDNIQNEKSSFINIPGDDEDTTEEQENINNEENYIESDSQKTSDNDNMEYLQIDIFDKEAIESLIIDRSKLDGEEGAPKGKRKRNSTQEETDEFFQEIKYPCAICKNVFQSRYSLRGHIRRAHNTNKTSKTFTCEICGEECRTRSTFVNHKLKHVEKQFKCELCQKAYSTKAHLKVHMTAHTNNRPYLCNVCGKDFNYANALTYHMRLHTGEKNYHCEYCPKRFRMINSLNRHVRTHTGEKPYKCQYCGRDFSSKGEVVCHEYIHTGYRPYHCKYCKKGFSKTHNLKIHLLSHGGPYHCDFCNKTFIEESILTMHHKISHKDMLTEESRPEGSDEDTPDSQDGATNQYSDDPVKIEFIEDSDGDFAIEEQVKDENSSE